jgi:tRNA modification GTPase
MKRSGTYAAILTPPHPAGIAVVALTGHGTRALLADLFRPARPVALDAWPDDRLHYGRLVDGEDVLDDAIVSLVRDTEHGDRAELNIHGGPRIVQRLLLALQRRGAEIVAGDAIGADAWAARTAIERAVYACLPRAQTRRAAAWLLRQRALLPAALRTIRAMLGEPRVVSNACEKLRGLEATWVRAGYLLEGLSIAIVGPPNAGKSTLANALCGHERVIVSEAPGTTRDYITEPAAVDGVPVTLVDTAGIRETVDPLEVEAVARARAQAEAAALRLVVLDAAAPLSAEARSLAADWLDRRPAILVLNKSDRMARAQDLGLRTEELGLRTEDVGLRAEGGATRPVVLVSALRGTGLDYLRRLITEIAGIDAGFDYRPAIFTPPLREAVRQALSEAPVNAGRAAATLECLTGDRDEWKPDA